MPSLDHPTLREYRTNVLYCQLFLGTNWRSLIDILTSGRNVSNAFNANNVAIGGTFSKLLDLCIFGGVPERPGSFFRLELQHDVPAAVERSGESLSLATPYKVAAAKLGDEWSNGIAVAGVLIGVGDFGLYKEVVRHEL